MEGTSSLAALPATVPRAWPAGRRRAMRRLESAASSSPPGALPSGASRRSTGAAGPFVLGLFVPGPPLLSAAAVGPAGRTPAGRGGGGGDFALRAGGGGAPGKGGGPATTDCFARSPSGLVVPWSSVRDLGLVVSFAITVPEPAMPCRTAPPKRSTSRPVRHGLPGSDRRCPQESFLPKANAFASRHLTDRAKCVLGRKHGAIATQAPVFDRCSTVMRSAAPARRSRPMGER